MYQGEEKTISQWAEIIGINRDTLKTRIYNGWSIKKAFETPVRQVENVYKKHKIKYQGEEKTISQWAEITGINRITLYCRLKAGWSIEKALETPVKK